MVWIGSAPQKASMLRIWSPDGGAIEWTQPKTGTYAVTKLVGPLTEFTLNVLKDLEPCWKKKCLTGGEGILKVLLCSFSPLSSFIFTGGIISLAPTMCRVCKDMCGTVSTSRH